MADLIIYTVVITLILAGVGYWLQYGTKAEIQLRQQARDWPKTTGTVTGSHQEQIKRWLRRSGSFLGLGGIAFHRYKPVIQYTYQVGGSTYESSKYKNGWLTRAGVWVSLNPKTVQKILAEHPQGKTVTVRYNPQDPAQAYLELDCSTGKQMGFRVAGLLVMAAAAGLFALGAYRSVESFIAQLYINSLPAAIPVTTEQLQDSLGSELGLTCQPKKAAGETMAYTRWECENSSSEARAFVAVYSRERAAEIVDYISAQTGETDPQKELAFFAAVARLAAPTTDQTALQDWLAQTAPTLTEMGSKAEIVLNGVKFILTNPNGLGLVFRIGELK